MRLVIVSVNLYISWKDNSVSWDIIELTLPKTNIGDFKQKSRRLDLTLLERKNVYVRESIVFVLLWWFKQENINNVIKELGNDTINIKAFHEEQTVQIGNLKCTMQIFLQISNFPFLLYVWVVRPNK
jgi:hypothetical protein